MRPFTALIALFLFAGCAASEPARTSCHPGPGPVGGVLLTVAADASGMVRVAQVAPGQDVPRDFVQQAMRAILTPPCGQFPSQGRTITFQIRLFPDP